MSAGTPNTSLPSWADRDWRQRGNSKGGGIAVLITPDGVILEKSLWMSLSAPQMLYCLLWVSVHVVCWEFTSVAYQYNPTKLLPSFPTTQSIHDDLFILNLIEWFPSKVFDLICYFGDNSCCWSGLVSFIFHIPGLFVLSSRGCWTESSRSFQKQVVLGTRCLSSSLAPF